MALYKFRIIIIIVIKHAMRVKPCHCHSLPRSRRRQLRQIFIGQNTLAIESGVTCRIMTCRDRWNLSLTFPGQAQCSGCRSPPLDRKRQCCVDNSHYYFLQCTLLLLLLSIHYITSLRVRFTPANHRFTINLFNY